MMREASQRRRELLQRALAGGDLSGKLRRMGRKLAAFVDLDALDARLARLQRAGVIDEIPGRWQLVAGAVDMLRFWVVPAAASDHEVQQQSFAFYQLLRFLAEPASILDPIGLFTDRDGIVGHLIGVAHNNPQYDLQLLLMFDRGVDELVRQLDALLAGTHPRAAVIRAILDEPDYPARLRAYVEVWRRDPARPFLRGAAVAGDAERTFANVTVTVRYMNRLPRTALGALRHLATTRTLPPELAEPRPPASSTASRG